MKLVVAALVVAALSSPGCIVVVHDRDDHVRVWREPSGGPKIGIEPGSLDDVAARQLSLDPDRVTVVDEVFQGSPAEHAGLRRCDIITRIDGRSDAGLGDLRAAIRASAPGQELRLEVLRDGGTIEIGVTPR